MPWPADQQHWIDHHHLPLPPHQGFGGQMLSFGEASGDLIGLGAIGEHRAPTEQVADAGQRHVVQHRHPERRNVGGEGVHMPVPRLRLPGIDQRHRPTRLSGLPCADRDETLPAVEGGLSLGRFHQRADRQLWRQPGGIGDRFAHTCRPVSTVSTVAVNVTGLHSAASRARAFSRICCHFVSSL